MHFNWLIVTFEFSFCFIFISFVKVHELFNGATLLAKSFYCNYYYYDYYCFAFGFIFLMIEHKLNSFYLHFSICSRVQQKKRNTFSIYSFRISLLLFYTLCIAYSVR